MHAKRKVEVDFMLITNRAVGLLTQSRRQSKVLTSQPRKSIFEISNSERINRRGEFSRQGNREGKVPAVDRPDSTPRSVSTLQKWPRQTTAPFGTSPDASHSNVPPGVVRTSLNEQAVKLSLFFIKRDVMKTFRRASRY